MTSWLRRLGFLCALIAGIFATHLVVAKPRLPFVVFATLDRAFASVDRAQLAPPASRDPLMVVLAHYEAELLVACDAASDALDRELARLADLAPERRAAALTMARVHLDLARGDLAHAATPAEYVEYDATCERLRDVRRMLA
ncbi:MAG: hypothetical protein ABI678_06770 [Kofleriaceae bacterium]